jgi:hypothetical protein
MTVWTPALVEERLAEAAFVLKRLPEPRRQGYFSTWPAVLHSFGDKVGHSCALPARGRVHRHRACPRGRRG